jgi:hypothetical protein
MALSLMALDPDPSPSPIRIDTVQVKAWLARRGSASTIVLQHSSTLQDTMVLTLID